MLADIFSAPQLIVAAIVILIAFGPQKLPEIFHQLGRGMRELKKATSEFSSALNTDENLDHTYDSSRYDSYSSGYSPSDYAPPGTLDEDPALISAKSETTQLQELPHGDFSAPAMADAAEDYGVHPPADGN